MTRTRHRGDRFEVRTRGVGRSGYGSVLFCVCSTEAAARATVLMLRRLNRATGRRSRFIIVRPLDRS